MGLLTPETGARGAEGEDVKQRAGRAAVVAGVLTVLLVLATVALLVVNGTFGSDPVSNTLAPLALVCYAVVGGLIASRLPRNACGWLLLAIGFGLVLTICAEELSTMALQQALDVTAGHQLRDQVRRALSPLSLDGRGVGRG